MREIARGEQVVDADESHVGHVARHAVDEDHRAEAGEILQPDARHRTQHEHGGDVDRAQLLQILVLQRRVLHRVAQQHQYADGVELPFDLQRHGGIEPVADVGNQQRHGAGAAGAQRPADLVGVVVKARGRGQHARLGDAGNAVRRAVQCARHGRGRNAGELCHFVNRGTRVALRRRGSHHLGGPASLIGLDCPASGRSPADHSP